MYNCIFTYLHIIEKLKMDNKYKKIIKLKNGIKCLIIPIDTLLTEISININFGKINEKPNETELAHYTEHLLGRITSKKYPNYKEIQNELKKKGAYLNASVDLYETRYYIQGLYQDIEFYVDILSNTIKDFKFQKDIEKQEKKAVSQELSQIMSNNSFKFEQKIWNFLYKNHSDIMDYDKSIKSLNYYDAKRIYEFIKKKYLLQNMTIILNCPLNAVIKTEKLINKYFNYNNKCPKCFIETPILTYKNKSLKIINVKNPKNQKNDVIIKHMVLKTIKHLSDEHIALKYIDDIFFNFETGIFFKELRDKYGLIYNIGLYFDIDIVQPKSSKYYIETRTGEKNIPNLIYYMLEIIKNLEITDENIKNSKITFKINKEYEKFKKLTSFNKYYGKYVKNNIPIVEISEYYKKLINIKNNVIKKYLIIFKKDLMKGLIFYYSKNNLNTIIKNKLENKYEYLSI